MNSKHKIVLMVFYKLDSAEESRKGWELLRKPLASCRHAYSFRPELTERLDRFAGIKPRDRIGEGVILGFVGNTGNARGTSPHLHYGIYSLNGKSLNPFPLLAGHLSSKNVQDVHRQIL